MEREVADGWLAGSLQRNLPDAAVRVVERVPDNAPHDPDLLEVVMYRGRFMRECPGTRHYFCCGYRILHFGLQCSLGCTYCILQAYLNNPNLRLFGNTEAMFGELERELEEHPGVLHRIGTGEFTDSLLLDPYTGLTRRLVPFFAGRGNAVLEIKSKTDFIGNLLELKPGGHTIVGWSMNSARVRTREESRTAPLADRLRAARTCSDAGYYLAFHFDPMIPHANWREGYGATLDRIFAAVDPSRVVYVSLGAFRFMPDLKRTIALRHPKSTIQYGEFIRGLDEKMRYYRDIRVELYVFMVERLRRWDPDLCVYLCMEGGDVWEDAFGFTPDARGGLSAMLDLAVHDRMGIAP
jgi:spore photoproduct lyase